MSEQSTPTTPPASQPASKRLLESRTLWVNGLTLAVLIGEFLSGQEWFSPQARLWIGLVLGIVNILLRFATSAPLQSPQVLPPGRPLGEMTVQEEYLYHKRRMAEMEAQADTGGERAL